MLQRNKRGYRLVTESGGGGAAERAVKSDSPISDLLLSVHPKGCTMTSHPQLKTQTA